MGPALHRLHLARGAGLRLACVDVDYRADGSAIAACVGFSSWNDAAPTSQHTTRIASVEPYVAGAFYRRELPCVLAVLDVTGLRFDVVIVDAYVVLDAQGTPGLGARLHAALGGATVVVGVAKTRFQPQSGLRPFLGPASACPSPGLVPRPDGWHVRFAKAATAIAVTRGSSASPLWITAIGIDANEAADRVREMHGPHRVPTLLRLVDRLARDA